MRILCTISHIELPEPLPTPAAWASRCSASSGRAFSSRNWLVTSPSPRRCLCWGIWYYSKAKEVPPLLSPIIQQSASPARNTIVYQARSTVQNPVFAMPPTYQNPAFAMPPTSPGDNQSFITVEGLPTRCKLFLFSLALACFSRADPIGLKPAMPSRPVAVLDWRMLTTRAAVPPVCLNYAPPFGDATPLRAYSGHCHLFAALGRSAQSGPAFATASFYLPPGKAMADQLHYHGMPGPYRPWVLVLALSLRSPFRFPTAFFGGGIGIGAPVDASNAQRHVKNDLPRA